MTEMPAQYTPPFWRLAVKNFLDGGFAPGDIVSFEWLYGQFEIVRPAPDTPLAQAQKAELAFLSAFQSFQEALLADHQIALDSVKGVGYQIIPPARQTAWAEDRGDTELKKALRKRRDRLVNVNMTSLTQGERRQNADALARLGALAGMAQRTFERKSALNIAPPETE
jgi:hypothetical protein